MQSQPSSHRRGGVGQNSFSREEWDLLVRLPGRVVMAATSAEPESSHHTVAEALAGIDAIAAGRSSESPFVRGVVNAIYAELDEDAPVAPEFADRTVGLTRVLVDCRRAAEMLEDRTSRADLDAYRTWLGSIASRVCHASPIDGTGETGGVLSAAEAVFLADLGKAFGR